MPLTARNRRLPALLAGALLALVLGACGGMPDDTGAVTERDAVTITLDRHPNATHAAIYAAQTTGAFERAGLDVTIETPASPGMPVRALQAGESDFVVMHQPDLLARRDSGAPLQAVAALIREPLTGVISLPKRTIRSAGDLEDRTIGTSGMRGADALLDAVLDAAGVPARNVTKRDIGFGLTRPLIDGKVDAVLGLRTVDAVSLRRDKKHPTVLTLEALQVPTHPELVLTATEQTVKLRGSLVRRVVQAISWGAGEVRDDPKVAADALVKVTGRSDRDKIEASLAATIPLMLPEDDQRPWGWMSPTEWAQMAVWMQEHGAISNARTSARGNTTEYLPGEGVGDRTDS